MVKGTNMSLHDMFISPGPLCFCRVGPLSKYSEFDINFSHEKCYSNIHIWKSRSKFYFIILTSVLFLGVTTSLSLAFKAMFYKRHHFLQISYGYPKGCYLFTINVFIFILLKRCTDFYPFTPCLLAISTVFNKHLLNMLTIYITFHLVSGCFKIINN